MNHNRVLSWEAHLIQRASAGETVAFELLSDLYRNTLHSLAMRMLRNGDDANDAVQDALVKAFRHIKEFDPERPIKPWLCRSIQIRSTSRSIIFRKRSRKNFLLPLFLNWASVIGLEEVRSRRSEVRSRKSEVRRGS